MPSSVLPNKCTRLFPNFVPVVIYVYHLVLLIASQCCQSLLTKLVGPHGHKSKQMLHAHDMTVVPLDYKEKKMVQLKLEIAKENELVEEAQILPKYYLR
jgi:hypothetical protein